LAVKKGFSDCGFLPHLLFLAKAKPTPVCPGPRGARDSVLTKGKDYFTMLLSLIWNRENKSVNRRKDIISPRLRPKANGKGEMQEKRKGKKSPLTVSVTLALSLLRKFVRSHPHRENPRSEPHRIHCLMILNLIFHSSRDPKADLIRIQNDQTQEYVNFQI
jgi:hypothetical protein